MTDPIKLKKCPPFCRQDCRQIHHPILLALVNVQEKDRKTLDRFIKLVARYYEHDLKPKTPLPDPIPEYRHPILLWAAVLGKMSAIEHLQTVNHDPRIQSSQKNESALHRVIHCFCPSMEKQHYTQTAIFQRFQNLVDLLAPALVIQDDNGDTPLHACATYITEYYLNARFNFYINALVYMIDKVASLEDNDKINKEGLDIQNRQGNTVFHLISTCSMPECVDLANTLLNNDANVRIKNDKGETVIDIAAEMSIPIFNLISERHNRLKRKIFDYPKKISVENSKKHCAGSSVVSSTSNDDETAGSNFGCSANHEVASGNFGRVSSHAVQSYSISRHASSNEEACDNYVSPITSVSCQRDPNVPNVKSSVTETVNIDSNGCNIAVRHSSQRNEHPQINSVSNFRVHNASNVKLSATGTVKFASDGYVRMPDPSQWNDHTQISSVPNPRVYNAYINSSTTETVKIASDGYNDRMRDSSRNGHPQISTTENNTQQIRQDQVGPVSLIKQEDVTEVIPISSSEEEDYALTLLEDLLKTADIKADVLKMVNSNRDDFALDLQRSKDFIRNLGEQERDGVNECNELDAKIQEMQRELTELKESVFSKRQMLTDIKTTRELEESTCYDLQQKIEKCDGIITRILSR